MAKKALIIFVCCCSFLSGMTQHLNAWTDQRNFFHVFDSTYIHQLEFRAVSSFKVGGKYVAYVDNNGLFKVYDKGIVKEIGFGQNVEYYPTDNFLVYAQNRALKVYENGKIHLLTGWQDEFKVGDSLVYFVDHNLQSVNVYYKNEVIDLIGGVANYSIQSSKIADNILAYTLQSNSFHCFYHGEIHDILSNNLPESYQVGRNLVAYVDPATGSFMAFYNGDIIQLEEFAPQEYKMGDDMIAYIDDIGRFKVFYKGEVEQLMEQEPGFFEVEDNLLLYDDIDRFTAYSNHGKHILLKWIPDYWESDNGRVCFPDQSEFLNIYQNGKTDVVSLERVAKFNLKYDTVWMQTGVRKNQVYYRGKTHSN